MASVIVQWIHIVCAVIAIGGVICLRLAVFPALDEATDEERERLLPKIVGRFRHMLWMSIGGLLATGLYNVFQVAVRGGLNIPGYPHVLVTKIALALVVFGISFMLTIPGPAFAGMKERRGKWMMVNLALGVVVLFLSAYLRRM